MSNENASFPEQQQKWNAHDIAGYQLSDTNSENTHPIVHTPDWGQVKSDAKSVEQNGRQRSKSDGQFGVTQADANETKAPNTMSNQPIPPKTLASRQPI